VLSINSPRTAVKKSLFERVFIFHPVCIK
jgi:hypothetical protein